MLGGIAGFKAKNLFVVCLVTLSLTITGSAFAADVVFKYPVKKPGHQGGDLTPAQAHEMVKEDSQAFIVDVRTRPEYVLVGHPTIAHHVPYKFWTGKHTSKGYGMAVNQDFYEDLKKKFNPQTDKLILMCRSGGRSCDAANAAVKAGWPAGQIYNLLGGFEGDKIKNKHSALNGKRALGGWKNEGLPWTYKVDAKLAYPEAH